MKKYEYKVAQLFIGKLPGEQDLLAMAGDEGWLLVAVVAYNSPIEGASFYFVREKTENNENKSSIEGEKSTGR